MQFNTAPSFRANTSGPDAAHFRPTNLLRRIVQSLSTFPDKHRSQEALAARARNAATRPQAKSKGQAKADRSPQGEFIERGEEMLRYSRRSKQPLSLLVFELEDLPELKEVFGRRATRAMLTRTIALLRCLATRRGLAAWTTPTTFTALVPGATEVQVTAALEAMLGPACCIEFEAGGDEILLVPELRVQTLGQAESLRQAYDAACRDITRVCTERQRRRLYLARERESHSRPAPLHAAATVSPARPECVDRLRAYAPIPATIPVPFGPRA